MQKKEWQRNVVIGIIVAAIFFGWWLRGFLYSNWHFRLFSRRSWEYVANEFDAGWMLNAKSDWIFLLTFPVSILIFLYLWYLCTKVRWRKLIKKTWKWIVAFFAALFAGKMIIDHKNKKNKKRTKLAPPPPAPIIKKSSYEARPKPMGHISPTTQPITNQMPFSDYSVSPTFTGTATQNNSGVNIESQNQWTDNMGDDISNMPLEDIQLPQREPVVEDIPALFSASGYQLIEQVKTSLQTIDFLAIAADHVYAVLIDKESGDWLAEEEPFNGEAPLWFSEVDHRVSPVYELRQSVTELQDKINKDFPDMKVKAFMIEQKGNIINAEEMLHIWKELDVTVSRTDIGGTEDLSITTDVIKTAQPASAAQIEGITKLCKGDK